VCDDPGPVTAGFSLQGCIAGRAWLKVKQFTALGLAAVLFFA